MTKFDKPDIINRRDYKVEGTLPAIAVLKPGSNFDTAWACAWDVLYPHLLTKFRVINVPLKCSNQYIARDMCVRNLKSAMTTHELNPEYVLWIDSDNILTPDGFDLLLEAIQANKSQIDAIGGWYWIDVEPPQICAAVSVGPSDVKGWLTSGATTQVKFESIQEAYDDKALVEVTAHMGFGALLMKTEMVLGEGEYPFSPVMRIPIGESYQGQAVEYMGDDVSFCRRTIAKGRRYFIHPDVYLPHLKNKELEAPKLKRRSHPSAGIEGWMSEEELNWLSNTAKSMDSIAEIGSWKGRSTDALLRSCDGPVYAIDHWKGSPDERLREHKEALSSDIYQQFSNNVGHYSNLRVICGDSAEIAASIPEVDMVFIDGAHDYESVKRDLLAYLPKARKIICGHDYNWEGVNRAVTEVLGTGGKEVWIGAGSIWLKFLEQGRHLPEVKPGDAHEEVPEFQNT